MAPQTHPNNPTSNNSTNITDQSEEVTRIDCCRTFTNNINHFLETGFEKIGFTIGSNPWKVIIIALLMSFLCMAGILELQTENRGEKNWAAKDSDPVKHLEWIEEVFPKESRYVGLLLERTDGGNMLTKQDIMKLYEVDLMVRSIYNGTRKRQWNDICYTPDKALGCIPSSILEIWNYNIEEISKLTDEQILDKLSKPKLESPMTGRNIFLDRIIGGNVIRNSNGSMISASVLKVDYFLKNNATFDKSEGLDVDENADAWEEALENEFEKKQPSGYIVYTSSLWSNMDASSQAALDDMNSFIFGYLLVVTYLSTMLGSFSRVGHKILLAFVGIGIIGLSIGVAYGLGSAFQLKSTGVHEVLPFLLLGIGIDDVFVIVQSWENIGGSQIDHRTIPEKVGQTLKRAGVSVLVTSLTDICAFSVGSATILPALRSFSLWCSIGILSIFLLTLTLFTAVLTLDAKRQEQKRDSILCCMKVDDDYKPMKCSETHFLKGFLKNYYGSAILSTPGKIFVLLAVVGMLSAGGYGLSELEQNFDFIWFLPKDSRPRVYNDKDRAAFPGNGEIGNVYIGQIDYYNGQMEMNKIKAALENDPYISEGTIHSWYHHYHYWLYQNHQNELIPPQNCTVDTCKVVNETRFYQLLDKFLETKSGKSYKKKIVFNADHKIRASQIGYTHTKLFHSSDQIRALDSITDTIKPGFISSGGEPLLPFVFSLHYLGWETDKVISFELVRNITLAGACVFVVTLFLLSNLRTSLMVLSCVAFSLIEIAAFMGFWGLTIDTVTTVILVLAIGLTVDYSVHIAHGFMVAHGESRNARVKQTLYEVGPAVIHGGTSTFLAFILLAGSESYVFVTFFKVFFLVVSLGMFHGIVYLPVALSLIGPAPHGDHVTRKSTRTKPQKEVELKHVRKTEDNFVVISESGEQNPAYLPESK